MGVYFFFWKMDVVLLNQSHIELSIWAKAHNPPHLTPYAAPQNCISPLSGLFLALFHEFKIFGVLGLGLSVSQPPVFCFLFLISLILILWRCEAVKWTSYFHFLIVSTKTNPEFHFPIVSYTFSAIRH